MNNSSRYLALALLLSVNVNVVEALTPAQTTAEEVTGAKQERVQGPNSNEESLHFNLGDVKDALTSTYEAISQRFEDTVAKVSAHLNCNNDHETPVEKEHVHGPNCNHGHDSNDEQKKDENNNSPVVEESSRFNLEAVKATFASTYKAASQGFEGTVAKVSAHPKKLVGATVLTTVTAAYALYKWNKAAEQVATLEEELEEIKALRA